MPNFKNYKFIDHCSGGDGGCPHIYQSKSKDGHFLIYDPDLPEGENTLKINTKHFKAMKDFFSKYKI
jgi:hypothetical protein